MEIVSILFELDIYVNNLLFFPEDPKFDQISSISVRLIDGKS